MRFPCILVSRIFRHGINFLLCLAFVLISACASADVAPVTETAARVEEPVAAAKDDKVNFDSVASSQSDEISVGKSATPSVQTVLKPAESRDSATVKVAALVASDSVIEKAPTGEPLEAVPQVALVDSVGHEADTDSLSSVPQESPLDPYYAFPALASSVFVHAESLYVAGRSHEATAYLERFRVLKPLWATWEEKADSMLVEFSKSASERAKSFEPMVIQIQNMMRVHSAYSIVASFVDSLVSLSPGDSLVSWAMGEKEVARKNTLASAMDEKSKIAELAESRGMFEDALLRVREMQMRYGDFEEELKLAELALRIVTMSQEVDAESRKFWETHDPSLALQEADSLIARQDFENARKLLLKLRASSLRKEALEKYEVLSEAFCNVQRKAASKLFAASRKQKGDRRKNSLQEAVQNLDRCVENYPEYGKIGTVIDNRKFLLEEMGR